MRSDKLVSISENQTRLDSKVLLRLSDEINDAQCYFQCVQVQQLVQDSVIQHQHVCMLTRFVTVIKIVLMTVMKLIAVSNTYSTFLSHVLLMCSVMFLLLQNAK